MNTHFRIRKPFVLLTIVAACLVLLAAAPLEGVGSGYIKPPRQDAEQALSLRKTKQEALVFDADNDQLIDPGDRFRYVITFANNGAEPYENAVLLDDYDQSLISISQISIAGTDNGDQVIWNLGTLDPGTSGEISYVATLKTALKPGTYKVSNVAAISADGFEPVEVSIQHEVNVEPTPVPTATPTPMPSPTVEPTEVIVPSATPEPPPPTVGASVPTENVNFYVIMGVLIGILELGGLIVIGVIACLGKFVEHERSKVVRVSMVVTMVVGAVLVMGVFGGIERGAAAGILGTVAGYLLRGIKEE